jgi:hypothetical protein
MALSTSTKVLRQTLVCSLGFGLIWGALTPAAKATVANAGTDYLITPPGGAAYTFNDPFPGAGSIRLVFKGLPIGTPTTTPPDGGTGVIGNTVGVADTVVNRLMSIPNSGDTTPIEIIGLSLQSVAPVKILGMDYDVFAGLQKYYPTSLGGGTPSTGTMTISGNSTNGGTWNSNFDVYGVGVFAPAGTLIPTGTDYVKSLIQNCDTATQYECLPFFKSSFTATAEPWEPSPTHGQIGGPNLVPGGAEDFYLIGPAHHVTASDPDTYHDVHPTPGPLPILGAPFAFASVRRMKRMSAALHMTKSPT